MYMKIHRSPDGHAVVAVCDRELLNTTVRRGEVEIFISEKFYGNTPVTEEEVERALAAADNVNLMGERCTAIAIRLGLICREGCIRIGTVPHAQIYGL